MFEFIRVGFWTSLSTLAKIISYLFIVKIIAIYTGPEGLGKMGQFMSLMTIVGVCAGGGISNGIIRYVAEYQKTNPDKIKTVLNSGFFITLSSSFAFFIICFSFSKNISILLFNNTEYTSVIVILSIAQLCIAINNFLFSIINGYKDVKALVFSNCVAAIISVIVSYLLIKSFDLYGVLLSLIFSQGCLVFITWFFIRNKDWLKQDFFKPIFDLGSIKNLMSYSLMAISTAILTPISHILIRDHIVKVLSWADAGYWQAITRISDVYLLFITMAMTVYYLPKLSEISDNDKIKKEIISTYKILFPAVCLLSLSIFLLKDIIIYILYGENFYAIRDLFFVQLLGDVVKISSWVISFLMLAKKKTKLFLSTEFLFSSTYVLLTIFLVNKFSLIGAMYSFLINSSFYLVFMVIIFYKGKLIFGIRNEEIYYKL
ncbi:MAG: O-antigen translocase [Alphaproteobacteria bacterium]|nr:O-antigen translocase [Alphaproteobacteria bacterium]